MERLVKIVTMLFAGMLVLGYLPWLHPATDSLAVGRAPLAIGLALSLIWTSWRWWIRWPGAVLSICIFGATALSNQVFHTPMIPAKDAFVHLQHNVWMDRSAVDEWHTMVTERAVKLATVQEVPSWQKHLLTGALEVLPHQHHCLFDRAAGVAVLSQFEFVAGTEHCADVDGWGAVQVNTPQGPLWVVSVHLHWPWPWRQRAQLLSLLSFLETLDGPVLISGDFNAMPWSYAVLQSAKAVDGVRMRSAAPTFALPLMPLTITIDHVLAGPGVRIVNLRPIGTYGSDHQALRAWVSLNPGP